jgi:hypothetical protein
VDVCKVPAAGFCIRPLRRCRHGWVGWLVGWLGVAGAR